MQYTDLIEALKPSEYRLLVKGWDKERYADIFKSDKYQHDKNGYRVYLPLGKVETFVSPIQQDIQNELSNFGFEVTDYLKGLAKNKNNGQNIKIGKVLTKLGKTDLLSKYTSDPTREAVNDEYIVVISRHPYDIAGMSTNRGWTSCMNLHDGENRHYVPIDIKEGTVVAYVTSKSDPDLKNPTGRVSIKPFVNVNNEEEIYFGIENKVYGTAVDGFIPAVTKWVNWVNKTDQLDDVVIVSLKSGLYNDSHSRRRVISNSTDVDEMIKKLVEHPYNAIEYDELPIGVQAAMLDSNWGNIKFIKNVNPTILKNALQSDPANVLANLRPGVKVPEDDLVAAVTTNPYSIEYIRNPSEKVQIAAVSKRGIAIEYISDPSEEVQIAAVTQKPNAIFNIKNPTEKVRQLYKELTS